jgi:hypothetical protein
MKKHTGLSVEQHNELVGRIRAARRELIEVLKVCARGYGWSSAITRRVPSPGQLERLRSALDEAFYREHGRLGPYYGQDDVPPELHEKGVIWT